MRKSKYSKELLEPIVKRCASYAEVLRELGLKISGGSYAYIKDRIIFLGIDTKHFTGQLWSKGKTKSTHDGIRRQAIKVSYTHDEIFRDGAIHKGRILKKAMLDSGVPNICFECKMKPMWNGKPISFHVDHINGNRRDCRKENLRILCPNCHQQTPTWGKGNATN